MPARDNGYRRLGKEIVIKLYRLSEQNDCRLGENSLLIFISAFLIGAVPLTFFCGRFNCIQLAAGGENQLQ
jgi:hypothetical protein